MNDRFKFRYWHIKKNEYIHTQCDCLAICHSCLQSIRDVPDVRGWYNTVLDQAYNDFELIPEQCTGLKDKNGKLIYEGDIVRVPDDWETYGFMSGEKREVYFRDGGFRLKPTDTKLGRGHWLEQTSALEIIGNIHEQAEQKD